jgi:hypothetical protein
VEGIVGAEDTGEVNVGRKLCDVGAEGRCGMKLPGPVGAADGTENWGGKDPP